MPRSASLLSQHLSQVFIEVPQHRARADFIEQLQDAVHFRQAQGAVAGHGFEVGLHHMVADLFERGFAADHFGHVGVGAGRLDQGLVE